MYPLEHFYYGQLVHRGKPTGETRILAQSKGITDEHLQLMLRQALLPANPDAPEGSWGILRGNKQIPFLFVQAQIGRSGQTTLHVISLTSDLMRQITGHVESFTSLVQAQIPTYEMIGDTLPPIAFVPMPERAVEQQIDDLLSLMTFTGNNTKKIEPLLAAIVHNKTLIVHNAPQDNQSRYRFVQGLLTLLPASTRFAVTFTTYNQPHSNISPQITFMQQPADDTVLYDWTTRSVSGLVLDDDYSRFIVGQLRLDAELSLQQADLLTPVAGWRFRSGDNLRDALAYASFRSKLDKAILNNLPAPVEEVSKVLAEDPTLTEEQRTAYAEHLMTLSIALGDLSACDPIAVSLQNNPTLERKILRQLQEVVQAGDDGMVFAMLRQWMDSPLSPQSPEWMNLLRQSALTDLDAILADEDTESLAEYLQDVYVLNQNNSFKPILPKIIERALPFSTLSDQVTSNIFLLALTYFDSAQFQKIVRVRDFAQNLARPIKRFLSSLSRPNEETDSAILISAADFFGEPNRQNVLIRLIQVTHDANAYSLIDTPTLSALVDFAATPQGIDHAAMLITIYRALEDRSAKMEEPANRYLLQILLAVGRYDLLAQGMIAQSRDNYKGDRQYEYVEMVQTLFAQTPMTSQQAQRVLESLPQHGIKSIPLIAASCGVLEATQWSADLASNADQNTDWLINNAHYLEVIHPEMVISIIRYYIANQQDDQLKRIVYLLPTCAVYKTDKIGLTAINRTYQFLIDAGKEDVAFEMLRQYIREAQAKIAMRTLQYFGKKLPTPQAQRLNFAYYFSEFLGRLDLETLALSVNTAVTLLKNNHASYIANARKPSRNHMMDFIADLNPRLTLEHRQQLVRDLRKLSQSLYLLGKQHQTNANDKNVPALIKGQEDPRSALDILRVMGGHFLRGRSVTFKLTPNAVPNPFNEQELGELVLHISITADLFQAMAKGIQQPKQNFNWTTDNIINEVDSMVQTLIHTDAESLKMLGHDLQILADILPQIYESTDNSVIDDNSRLSKRLDQQTSDPNSVLEMYRFIAGYFARD